MSTMRSIRRARSKRGSALAAPGPLKLSEQSTAEILGADARLTDLEQQHRIASLERHNLILEAALEMGLTKERLSQLELVRVNGTLVFRKPAAEQKSAAPTPAPPPPPPPARDDRPSG